jgi:hypothetical protein
MRSVCYRRWEFFKFLVSSAAILVASQRGGAQDFGEILPLANSTTFAIGKFQLQPSEVQSILQDISGLEAEIPQGKSAEEMQVAHAQREAVVRVQRLVEALGDHAIYLACDIPTSSAHKPIRLAFDAQLTKSLVHALGVEDLEKHSSLLGNYRVVAISIAEQTTPHTDLDEALPEAQQTRLRESWQPLGDVPAGLIIVPPEFLWRTVRELLPQLPDAIGGGPSSLLTEGIEWISVEVSIDSLQLRARIQSRSEAAATALAERLPGLLELTVRGFAHDVLKLEQTGALELPEVEITVQGDQIWLTSGNWKPTFSRAQLIQAFIDRTAKSFDRIAK